jgi:hypothetical protein
MKKDNSVLLIEVINKISFAHLQDPNLDTWNNEIYPAEWLYIQRITERMEVYQPEASPELIIAANCQHLCRWEIGRKTFPEGRAGYYQWRNFLSEYQFQKAREIILKAGFDEEFADRVKAIVKKENIFTHAESQTLEDVVCLVFMEFYLDEFIRGKSELDMSTIIQKTWKKMSEKGHQEAMKINYTDGTLAVIKQALGI